MTTDYLKGLRISLVLWLAYRVFCIPIIFVVFTQLTLNLALGMLNQILWLIPVWLSLYFLWQGRKPYALIWVYILLLVYLAGSGLQLLHGGLVCFTYAIDFILLLSVHIFLFLHLKKLPQMHKSTKN